MGKKKAKAKPATLVLDCSVTVSWFFEDETDVYAESVEDAMVNGHRRCPVSVAVGGRQRTLGRRRGEDRARPKRR